MEKEQQAGVQMPINKLSYSGLTQLLRNPLIFKLKYILGVYDGKIGPSGMVGRAGHEALKLYYGGNKDIPVSADHAEAVAQALDHGMKYLEDFNDAYIDYGKTGSRESMLKSYTQAMQFYFAEEPEYNNLLMVEEKMDGEMKTVDGDTLPLPAVGVPDLVEQKKDETIDIIDTKFVKSFTDYETEDYIKIVQSQFLYHLLKSTKGIVATRMVFREIKTTKNMPCKDLNDQTCKEWHDDRGCHKQVRDYVIPFEHEQYRTIFYNLYKDVVGFLKNPNAVYLPNLSDPFDGEQAGLLYAQGLLNADMSDVEVMHKVKDVAFVSKKFVPSRLDRVENKYLLPEEKIKLRLAEFGIPVEPEETKVGPSVTQYRFKVSAGIRMSSFEKHKADIARAIEARGEIRILAPIPGTALVGVEVPNEIKETAILSREYFMKGTLSIPIGQTVQGEVIKVPLNEMPHLLIAGATGSGKSVLLHSTITALIKQLKPEELQLVLIDPKRVELSVFAKAKHLHGGKIVYEYEEAMIVLRGLCDEMEVRYKKLEKAKARDIREYNIKVEAKLPYIVLVVDEFADLILQSKEAERKKKRRDSIQNIATRATVERMAKQFAKMGIAYNPEIADIDDRGSDELIAKLAAMARAVGIHLIIATQRPSVDVITGLIKANFPTRIALTTASPTDSKVILGVEGAEKLTGKGDMLFMHPGGGVQRLQGFLTK